MAKQQTGFAGERMADLYIDTNIFVYALQDTENKFGVDMSNSATKLFEEAASCKFHVIVSEWAVMELSWQIPLNETKMFFELIKKKTIQITYTEEDVLEAKKINPNHYQDALHYLLAIKANADYIVTRNTDDFQQFKDKIKIIKPEKLMH